MGFYTDDWKLRYSQDREGELYREKERLKEEMEDTRNRQRQEDYEREQAEYRVRLQRERQRENSREERWNILSKFEEKDDKIELLELRIKFGIEEGEP